MLVTAQSRDDLEGDVVFAVSVSGVGVVVSDDVGVGVVEAVVVLLS